MDRATFDRPDPPTETELLSLRLEGLDCETGYNRNTGEEPTEKPGDDLSLEAALGDLALLVNDLNYHTDLLNIYAHSGDFGSLVSQPVGQGTFFQVRKVDGIDKQMVAKVPRTDLIGNDRTANSATTLASIKSELETLCHEPVRRHPNVVDILGLGWARLESTTDLAIPVLFLEFATYGTLAQYLETKLGPEKRLGIASDVTKGLQVLHACGIIHGDLKLENVLVFQDGNGSAIAKLADFGSSYPLKDRDFPPKGRSPLWAAPEWDRRIEPDELHKTDIYSLGLLIWRLCLEGANPFYGMDSGNVDERKRKDLVLFDAKKSIEDYYDFTKSWQFNLSDAELFDMYVFCVILPKSAFNYSLCLDPKMRHLGGVLASLSLEKYYGVPSNEDHQNRVSTLRKVRVSNRYMKLHDAPRYVKQMVLDRLTGQSRDRLLTNEQRGEACMQAAFAYIDGFVGNPDFQLGLRWINEAAQHDYIPVLGVAYRLLQACAQPLSEEEKQAVQRWLFSAACVGSSTASQDLKLLDFNGYTEAREKSKTQYYLPGVEVMEKSPEDIDRRVLSSGRLQEFGREFYMRDTGSIATQLERLVNDHGDTFLHCSVVYGSELPDLITYLKTSPSNIDARNKDGNTALLLAMQLGFHEKAKALLCAGADPTISNELGQTPCHWIIHIDASSDPGELLDSLIMKNANLQACAQKETDVRHYSFAAVVGTPLHWAVCQGRLDLVRCFLDRGADPLFQYQQQTPVDLAVSLHYWQILELLLSRPPRPVESTMHLKRSHAWLKQPGERSSASNWVGLAVQTFPPHVRMILHGNSFLTAFRQTLDTLDRAGLIDQTMFHPFQAAAIDNKIDLLQTIFSMWQRAGSGEEVTFLYSLLGSVISQIMQEPALFLLDKLDDACLSATMPDMSPILLSYVASLNADPIVLHRLLGYVDDVDIRNEQGYTPFAIAVRSRNYEIATELLGVGADPDLLFRAGNSDSNVLKVNILHDFIVADNDLSLFPLQYLLEPQHPFKDRVPSFLVDTELGYTALHVAALWKARSVFGYILNKFGDPTSINAKANDGWTALHMAAHCGHYDHAKRLCEKGALLDVEVEMIGEDVPYTPLDMCNNPNRHWTNWPSNNVYWEEVFLSRLRTFEYLKSEGGYSRRHTYLPLHVRFLRCAVFQGLGNLFVEALKRELDPIMRQQFLNALLFHSSKFGDVGMVERLLLAGADVHDRSAKGRTPLHIAAKHNKVHVVRSLFKAGADLHVKDLEGRSAFKEAFLSTCHSAQSLLLAYGAEKEYAGNEERMLAISQASEARQRAQFRYDWKSRKEERKIEVNPGETFRDQWAPYTTQDGISKRKRMRPPFS